MIPERRIKQIKFIEEYEETINNHVLPSFVKNRKAADLIRFYLLMYGQDFVDEAIEMRDEKIKRDREKEVNE